jgi:Tfp pilus assembly PilM family ATPase
VLPIALVMNIMSTKKVNKSLLDNIEGAQAYLRVAMDTSMEYSKQLEIKSADLTAKEQQLASLAANVNTLTNEKNQMQEQLVKHVEAQKEEAPIKEAPKEEAQKEEVKAPAEGFFF